MDRDLAARVASRVRADCGYLLTLLEALTRAESPSSTIETHAGVRRILAAALESVGFRTRPVSGRERTIHLYASPRNRRPHAPAQLLLGHLDTVWPVSTLETMPYVVDGDTVRGPGVFDMKGGLALMIVALRALRDLGLDPPATPVVFVNADEEIGSRTSTRIVRRLARRVARAFVLEPALGPQGALKTTRKAVGRFVVTVHGRPAHAGLDPGAGASAILELSYVIQDLFALNDPERGISVNVGTVDGGLRPNVIAPHSQAVVDVRANSTADADAIARAIHAIEPRTPGVRLRVDGAIGRPALESTPRNRALWALAKELGSLLDIELDETRAGGGSDGNTTSLYTATLDGLGAVGDGAHAEHECLSIDATLGRAALLALLLLVPAGDTGPAS